MDALIIDEVGADPRVGGRDEPERPTGQTLVEVLAAPLNPIDLAVAAGRFYGGHPPLPYVAGSEAVGRVLASDTWPVDATVWAAGGGPGVTRDGTVAQRALVGDAQVELVPAGLDPAAVATLGIAGLTGFLAVDWRGGLRPDDVVCVLGATGAVGTAAVRTAALGGAQRVVAVGRDAERLEQLVGRGADATVSTDVDDLAAALREACGGQGPTLVIDPLWGAVGAAAVEAAAPRARIVQLGQSAGAEARLTSASIRGSQVEILGFSLLTVPAHVRTGGFARLLRAHAAGDVVIDHDVVDLPTAPDAWRSLRDHTRKVVVTP